MHIALTHKFNLKEEALYGFKKQYLHSANCFSSTAMIKMAKTSVLEMVTTRLYFMLNLTLHSS